MTAVEKEIQRINLRIIYFEVLLSQHDEPNYASIIEAKRDAFIEMKTHLQAAIETEKQQLQDAWEAGKESKTGHINENYGSPFVEYEYTETFNNFYSKLKGE